MCELGITIEKGYKVEILASYLGTSPDDVCAKEEALAEGVLKAGEAVVSICHQCNNRCIAEKLSVPVDVIQ